jgi:putative transcriptional regulator
VACEHLLNRDIFGYTVLDSIKAILELSGSDFYQILGSTTERALIFTEVKTGRSPMVAVRVQQPKPKMIVLHKPEKVDELAIELAKAENIPLVLSNAATVRDLLESLNNLTMSIKLGRVEL